MLREAEAIHREDVAACREMGRLGAALLPEGATVLTHCNAGALATGGYCKARRRLPEGLLPRLVRDTADRLQDGAPGGWLWHGRRVVIVDGSSVSMPDTPANQAAYPQHFSQKRGWRWLIWRETPLTCASRIASCIAST